jgi:hypothetical protein
MVIDEVDHQLGKFGAQSLVVLHPDFFRQGEQNEQPGHERAGLERTPRADGAPMPLNSSDFGTGSFSNPRTCLVKARAARSGRDTMPLG